MKSVITVGRPILYALIQTGAIFLTGLFVMLVWNAVLIELFGAPHIYYWQSVGIIFLAHNIIPFFSLLGSFKVKIETEN